MKIRRVHNRISFSISVRKCRICSFDQSHLMRTLSNIIPSPEQLVILSDAGPGFRLIRGAAGSGKTTAAILRLRQLCTSRLERRARLRSDDPVRVLVLTFNRTLRGYISELVNEQLSVVNALDLTVDTFGRWALHRVGQHQLINENDRRNRIQDLLRAQSLIGRDLAYFTDEVEYIVGRFPPARREEYLEATRSGRGRAPAVPRRIRQVLLTDVVNPYDAEKVKQGLSDWNDIAVKACITDGDNYDVVIVDEAQDLSGNQIRAILSSLSEDHATTFIMDTVQRIYPQGFSWREVGIDMRPQMVFALTRNHRNTKEIAGFAASLVRDLPMEEDGLVPDERGCELSGPIPRVIEGRYADQLNFMLNEMQPALESGETIAILQPKGGGWFAFVKQTLEGRGIDYCDLTRERVWPTGPELVALATIHSAKGVEFDHVLLPGLNQEVTPHGMEEGDGRLDSLRRLVAMGIGRARRSVLIGYKPGEESTLIRIFDPETYELVVL